MTDIIPVCPVCGKETHMNRQSKIYTKYCSRECQYRHTTLLCDEKIQNILRQIGLSELPSCIVCGKQLTKKQFLEHSTAKYCSMKCMGKDPNFVKIRAQTNLNKYGCANPFSSKEIQEKSRSTNLKRYGVEVATKNKDVIEKSKKTRNERYGTYASPDFTEKVKRTNIKRYGVDYPQKLEDNKNHFENGELLVENDRKLLLNKDWLYQKHIKEKLNTVQISNLLERATPKTVSKYIDINIDRRYWKESNFQNEVIDYIKNELNIDLIKNDRKTISPYELDIFISTMNIAIECNGVYWHSKYDKKYHINKTNLCKSKNIRLIHIDELTWKNKTDIYKGILKSILQKNSRVFARKTKMIELTDEVYNNFIDKNHLQGKHPQKCSIKLGLIDKNNELLMVIGLGKSRYKKNSNKENVLELYRVCSKIGITVVGGLSKLLSKVNNEIISYSDIKYSVISSYKNSGFYLEKITEPGYQYFKGKLFNRLNFQKHKLKDILDFFDPSMTEKENMLNNGYQILWDCGQYVLRRPARKIII